MGWHGYGERYRPRARRAEPKLWTGREVAEVLGTVPSAVYYLARTHQLAAVRLTPRGNWLYPIAAVKQLMAKCGMRLPRPVS